MRHVKLVTRGAHAPKQANTFQNTVCLFVDLFAGLIGAIGGAEPIVDYLNTKCNFGVNPNANP